jgi:UDP-glucose 4-epimerase
VKVLITGGAGYIGSTIASACIDAGITPVVLDSLVEGRREFVRDRIFYEGDIADGALIDQVFADHPEIEAVVHCAALIVVAASVEDPVRFYRWNVAKSLEMFSHLLRNGCHRLVFSSSASIYRPDETYTVDEDSAIGPNSPYAGTKAVCEQMFADIAASTPIKVLSLRYFNPIGADPKLRTGLQTKAPTHVVGKLVEAHTTGVPFLITGTSYSTRDGSGIRDYIHVWDLASAHVAALTKFDEVLGEANSIAVNVGSGNGVTVRELVAAFNSVVGTPVQAVEAPARPGDVPGVYTRSARARRLLGWEPAYTVAEGIEHALAWAAIRDDVLGAD